MPREHEQVKQQQIAGDEHADMTQDTEIQLCTYR